MTPTEPKGPVSAPHAHENASITRTMVLVMLALTPATTYGLYQFGWPAVNLFVVTLVSALAAEAICLRIAQKPVVKHLRDGSALLSGWLLAMTLPPWCPWWIGVIGAFTAIVIGKHIFGGLGQNVFNPAMVARVVLLISFPVQMTFFIAPVPMGTDNAPSFLDALSITFSSSVEIDTVSSASVLSHVKTELSRGRELGEILANVDTVALMLGATPGSLGETSGVLILLGGLALILLRVITWHIPVAMLATLTVLATTMNLINPGQYPGAALHILSGATLLGAFFIATDLVTAPVNWMGRLIFGAGCGILVYVIRTFAAFPEGVGFAVLLMNAMTPLIDYYVRPRIYGRARDKKPLTYSDDQLESKRD